MPLGITCVTLHPPAAPRHRQASALIRNSKSGSIIHSYYQRCTLTSILYQNGGVQLQVNPSLCLFVDLILIMAVHWLRAACITSRQLYDTCHFTAPPNLRLRQFLCRRSRRHPLRRVEGLTRSHGACQVCTWSPDHSGTTGASSSLPTIW